MKPVIIKNIEIGKGLPKIAVPLVAANTQELEQALRVLKETAFDIIEFRADFFQAALDAYFIAEQLGIARQAFPDKPLLFTFRRAQEGGNTPCSDDYYFELLEKIIRSKQADIIDIELFAEESGVKQTIALAHEYQTAALLCNHDFQATPSLADITGRLKAKLTLGIKQNLIKTLHCQICIERQHFSTLAAIDKMVSSFQASVTDKNAKQLKLPEILPLKEYQYE